ncbi:ran-binding protein b [Trifolium repens]|nr:ran-binding protein b [Trifolium repens]
MVGGVKIQNFTFPLCKFHYFDPSPTQFHYSSLNPKICIFHSVAPTSTLTLVALQNRLNHNVTNLLVPSLLMDNLEHHEVEDAPVSVMTKILDLKSLLSSSLKRLSSLSAKKTKMLF